MTDQARLAALEAVAEAAVELDRLFNSGCPYLSQARNKMHLAIRALRALPAPQPQPQPAREAVTLAAHRSESGVVRLSVAGSDSDTIGGMHWTRLGTVKLTVERGE